MVENSFIHKSTKPVLSPSIKIPLYPEKETNYYYNGKSVCDYVLLQEIVHFMSSSAHTPLQV